MRILKTSILLTFIAIQSTQVLAQDLTADGIKAFRNGDYIRAEQLYRQALAQETDDEKRAAIFRDLNVLYQAQGKDGSDFSRQADQLDPPSRSTLNKADGQSELIINQHKKTGINTNSSQGNSSSSGSSNSLQVDGGAAQNNPVIMNGAYGSASSSSTMYGGGLSPSGLSGAFGHSTTNGAFAGGGGFMNRGGNNGIGLSGGFNRGGTLGGFRTFGGGYPAAGAYPGPGGYNPNNSGFASVQNGNNYFEYSNNTPVVLPAPNGGAIILNAPGPNIYSTQTAPDGSTTTIMKRTY